MKAILFILTLFMSSGVSAQGRRGYFSETKGHVLQYETKEFTDTIWLRRDSLVNPGSRHYKFKFTVVSGDSVMIGYSRRIGGADPDTNCGYTPGPLMKGDSGKITICFPGRIMGPPFVLRRRYIANTSAEKRDTLVINQVYRWIDRDTIHEKIKVGDRDVKVVRHRVNNDERVIFINVHQDEQTSIDVLKGYAKHFPINYWYLEHDSTRRIQFNLNNETYTVDPNRIYSDTGVVNTLYDGENYSDDAYKETRRLGNMIKYYINNPKRRIVVTLHNNTADEYSILSYQEGEEEAQNAKDLYINSEMDPDDFIYTTDQWIFDRLKVNKINVILQNNQEPIDDGSMSVYCGFEGIPYINIEAEHGHSAEQYRLLKVVDQLVQMRLKFEE